MSLVLAFDTATAATVVAIARPDGSIVERRDDPLPGARPLHAQRLLALCEEALSAVGADWAAVTRVGVGVGPGTFTGLRIGTATAQALVRATGVEAVPVSTLGALAHAAAAPGRPVLAVLDARRAEVFAALAPPGGEAARAAALAPADIGELAAPRALAVGDGAVRYREQVEAAGCEVPPDDDPRHRVGGASLAALAAAGAPVPVASLVPDYVRLPDAELHRRRVAAGP